MTATAPTVTDLFCGAGGSSEGAARAGLTIEVAANHWQTAIDVHQIHHPDARHDVADISAADPRRYPATNILLASPECTNHSQARGVSRKQQTATLFDPDFDPAAEKSRATMWCVVRFAEQIRYDAIVVENVVEVTKWVFWDRWIGCMTDLGYQYKILSHNSMHHGVAQSRDRVYIVFWRKGLNPNLELELVGWCARCEDDVPCRQAWKNNRTVGRYRTQYIYACTRCGHEAVPATEPAASIIDFGLACPRIGDRKRPLADKTRSRIGAGLERYGWAEPITTAGAGNVHERTPGNRARSIRQPVDTQQTTATTAVATPPAFLFQTAHEGRIGDLGDPHPTVTASDDRHSLVQPGFQVQMGHGKESPSRTRGLDEPAYTAMASGGQGIVVPMRTNGVAYDAHGHPVGTVSAGGNHHGLLVRSNGFSGSGQDGRFTSSTDAPAPTMVTTQRPALLMRNNLGGAEMVTPVDEPARTMTTAGHQSLLMPYYGTGRARPVTEPAGTMPTKDRFALVNMDQIIDDCGFRMLEPYEVAAAMAFPVGYIPRDLTKRDQVKLAGNAVTPPVMTWVAGRLLQALEAAA